MKNQKMKSYNGEKWTTRTIKWDKTNPNTSSKAKVKGINKIQNEKQIPIQGDENPNEKKAMK